jgi:acyl-CoA hydrolase
VELDDMSRVIGGYIADEVPHEATFQLGIGAIPEAVGLALRDKRNLGIHTELLTDSMIELIRCGAVTNAAKPIHRGKTVATLSYGSQDMYDYIHENDDIEFLPVDYTNDPAVIARHPKFMSVNGALAVDFYGQVCAESLGTRHVSGTGGQSDYVRGAISSPGGKSFIAFPSTAAGGTVSRIAATLPLGSVVSTSKNDVDCIVTEYGIARLRGKTLWQRTKELIAVAHPDFRDQLLYDARRMNIIV